MSKVSGLAGTHTDFSNEEMAGEISSASGRDIPIFFKQRFDELAFLPDPGSGMQQPDATILASTRSDGCLTDVRVVSTAVYPKEKVGLLKLKCPAIKSYCDRDQEHSVPIALQRGFSRILTFFNTDAGGATLDSATGEEQQHGLDESYEESIQGSSGYTCAQARLDGSSACPRGGCPLPDGTVAQVPTDVLLWDCNIKEVGQAVVAQSVSASEYSSGLIGLREDIYAYSNGYFRRVDEAELYSKVMPHLGPKSNLKFVDEIQQLLRVAHATRSTLIVSNPNMVCFENGTLDLAERVLKPHSASNHLMNSISFPYDPEAQCPGFLSFLQSVWGADNDFGEKTAFLREWMGYLLTSDASMQKMVILKGEGANGKSVLMDVIRAMIGEDNIVSVMLDRLRQPYVRATLEAKLLNQSADLPKRGIVSDGDLKAIISGDSIEVSPKHKPSYTIKPYARLPNCRRSTTV